MALKRQEEKRTDEQLIDILRNQIKTKMQEMELEVDKKITKEVFEKEKQKIAEKIHIVQENLTDKADKGDMKKAFLFLEEKIKQIIVLMAGEQGYEKDGAIKKIPTKCLSCDKHIETESSKTSRLPSPREK